MTTLPDQKTELLSTIRQRRTVDLTLLKPDPIPRDVLLELLEAANWAPSHGRTEPWRFAVFSGPGRSLLSAALAESMALLKGQEAADPEALKMQVARQQMAPVWLAVAVEPAEKPKMPLYEEQWAVACAVQNLLLAARAHGIGSKWISNPQSLHEHTARRLGFAPGASMMGLVYLGYVQEDPAGQGQWPEGTRRPLGEKVRWVDGPEDEGELSPR